MKNQESVDKNQQKNIGKPSVKYNLVSIFNAIGNPAQIINKDHIILEVNEATLAKFSLKREELIGKKCYSIFHNSETPPDNCPLDVVTKDNKSLSDIVSIEMNNTTHTISCAPIYDDEGNYDSILHIMTDITERKIAEENLIKEKNKAQQYLNIAGVMLVNIDTSGIVQLINPKGSEILGYSEKEIVGTNWFDNYIPKSQRKKIKDILKKVFNGKDEVIKQHEIEILTKYGDIRLITWNIEIIKDSEGKITGVLASGEDITERKKTEYELHKHRIHLEELVKQRTHELDKKNEKLNRINKLFIGRELRMKELKEELKKQEKE